MVFGCNVAVERRPRLRASGGRSVGFWLAVSLLALLPLSASVWAAPYVPTRPRRVRTAAGARLVITGPGSFVSGERGFVGVTVDNRGRKFIHIPGFVPTSTTFPGVWCWRRGPLLPVMMLRWERDGYRMPYGGSETFSGALPDHRFSPPPINYSRIFDLSVPGKYEAQLAGKGMISNVIKFRVLPPKDKTSGPALLDFAAKLPKSLLWGKVWNGVQIAAYVENNPGIADPIAHVRMLLRCAGKHAATISLTGNPHIDFARRNMVGPFHTVRTIDGKPVPLTAYGKLLASRHNQPPPAKQYTLRPGIVYTYWRRLVLNREFDLSVYGPYRFSTRLDGTGLKTAPSIIYVGVQARFYKHVKIPE